MKQPSRPLTRRATWAGITAPVVFVGAFLLQGSLRPGDDQLSSYVSALSLGEAGWIQIVNFLVFGALLFFFAWFGAPRASDWRVSAAGPIVVIVMAVAYVFSGPFVMDPAGTPAGHSTLRGMVHGILGAIAFLLMPVACFVFLGPLRSRPSVPTGDLCLGARPRHRHGHRGRDLQHRIQEP